MLKFKVSERSPSRFEGDFLVEPEAGYNATTDEHAYIDKLNTVLADLARDQEDDDSDQERAKSAYVLARKDRRKFAAAELLDDAKKFVDDRLPAVDRLSPATALDNALVVKVVKGKYRRNLELLSESLFVVREIFDNARAVDLKIEVSAGLLAPNEKPPQEKERLFVALGKATMVVRTVCQRITERGDNWFNRKFSPQSIKREGERAALLLDANIRKLAGVGRLGLEGPHTSLAVLALNGQREEFVAQEAGRIKNSYIRSLGIAAGSVATLFLAVYILIASGSVTSTWWLAHKTFLLAGSGAAIGT